MPQATEHAAVHAGQRAEVNSLSQSLTTYLVAYQL